MTSQLRIPLLPATSDLVERQTDPEINREIQGEMRQRIAFFCQVPERIEHRLSELDREWNIERVLEANAATLACSGALLGLFKNRAFLMLPAVVGGFLLQHALQGWCPPVPLFRRMGIRTAREIERERHALKLVRGDYGVAWADRTVDEILSAVG